MIRVQRPRAVPKILQTRGASARQAFQAAHDAGPQDYASGDARFEVDSEIYAAAEVKAALRQAQHDKCCFCESKVTHISYGDIEHFRPKAAFRQHAGGRLQRPGYYWLAYEWTNLFFCCQLCNQRHKQILFPLRRATRRARSHRGNVAAEEPLFLNPEEDPMPHLGFRQEYLYPVRRSRRGRTTIEALSLNRDELVERRRDHLAVIRLLLDGREWLANALQQTAVGSDAFQAACRAHLASLDDRLRAHCADDAQYAAMARVAAG
jgi:uncharacterized protein (TIGR02646 family)